MIHIKDVSAQPHVPFPKLRGRTRTEAIEELTAPCSRFKTPFSARERARIFAAKTVQPYDPFRNSSQVIADGTPLNWQFLLTYLHAQGIIESPRFLYPPTGHHIPKIYRVMLAAALHDDSEGFETAKHGYAAGITREIAMSKVIGETLERHLFGHYKRSELRIATFNELREAGTPTLDIFALNGFLPFQEAFEPAFKKNPDAPIAWVEAGTLAGDAVLVPAQLVYWTYRTIQYGEPLLGQQTTSGCAGHFTRDEALLSSLLETIQRDGFLIYWLNSISPNIIEAHKSTDREIIERLAYLKRYGFEAHFVNTTTDLNVPSVTCVLVDTRCDDPIVTIGGGTGFTEHDTILHSLLEALAVHTHADTYHMSFSLPSDYVPFVGRNVNHPERVALWRGKAMYEQLRFFIAGKPQSIEEFLLCAPALSTPQEALAYVRDRFEALGSGYEVYAFDLKHPILDELGYHLVRAIVPQMVTLYLHEHTAMLDSKRLREVPGKLGYTAAAAFNPLPHPFP